jgi:hypothetical protein
MHAKNEGLSLGYRFKWRLDYVLLHAAGPATLSDELDPRSRMKRQRAARARRARRERWVREVQSGQFLRRAELRGGVLADGVPE